MLGQVPEQGGADWIAKSAQRGGGLTSLLAAAVSSDGRYLAVGGGDRKVHVWDARSQQYIQVKICYGCSCNQQICMYLKCCVAYPTVM